MAHITPRGAMWVTHSFISKYGSQKDPNASKTKENTKVTFYYQTKNLDEDWVYKWSDRYIKTDHPQNHGEKVVFLLGLKFRAIIGRMWLKNTKEIALKPIRVFNILKKFI